MTTSVYASMINLNSRKTVIGLELFNSLVESGLVHFLNQKEEKATKAVEVSATELQEARAKAEKALATARATKAYHGTVNAKKAVSVRAIYSALKACKLAAFKVEQLTVELAFAKEQVAIVAARQAV